MKLNLHVHSTCSDGRKTPTEIAELMQKNNVTFALTDHDTVMGLKECYNALDNKELLINGIEFSSNLTSHDVTLHVLAYDFDVDIVENKIKSIAKAKNDVLKKAYYNLLKQGHKLHIEDEENINKTHLADQLVANGFATDSTSAKRNIINPLIDDHCNLEVTEIIDTVHKANGKLFWAHPYEVLNKIGKIRISNETIETIVQELISYNIDGLEVYYANYKEEQVLFLKSLCEKYNLLFSTGTDIHFNYINEKLNCDLDDNIINNIYNSIKTK